MNKSPNFAKYKLIPVIIQDFKSLKVLMLAYMNSEAFEKTVKENIVHFFSRSRNALWKKGEQSGNIQKVKRILFDCDDDTLVIQVEQIGDASCHTGHLSCFYRELKGDSFEVVEPKIFDPNTVYRS